MSHEAVPPALRRFVERAGADLRLQGDGALTIGDSENRFVIRHGEDEHVVHRLDRGVVGPVELRTDDVETVWRFVVVQLAYQYRSAVGLPRLASLADLPPVPPGVRLSKVAPRRSVVRWSQDGVDHHAEELDDVVDQYLARAVTHPLETLLTSVADTAGAPLLEPVR